MYLNALVGIVNLIGGFRVPSLGCFRTGTDLIFDQSLIARTAVNTNLVGRGAGSSNAREATRVDNWLLVVRSIRQRPTYF
ncbi:protein of unknown function [Pararobbsia alpina]